MFLQHFYRGFLILLLSASALAIAAETPENKDSLQFSSGIERGKQYLNGGIGQEDASQLRKLAKQYPLMVSVSEGSQGAYLAKLSLTIFNEQRVKVFKHLDVGPILLVDLPDGRYQLVAEYQSQKRSVIQMLEHGKTAYVYFNWPDKSVPPKVQAPQDASVANDMDEPARPAVAPAAGGPDDLSIP